MPEKIKETERVRQKKRADPMPRCKGCGDTSSELRAGRCEACRGGIYWTEDGLLVVRGHQPEGEISFTPDQQKVLVERITQRWKPKERPQVEDVVEAVAVEQPAQAEKKEDGLVMKGAKVGVGAGVGLFVILPLLCLVIAVLFFGCFGVAVLGTM